MASAISQLYSSLESMEVSLGGGGGFEGFYGSITAGGLSRIYTSMAQHCAFGESSFLVDVGGGLGRPLMHAMVEPGIKSAIGIEVDEIKCMKSESVIQAAYKKMLGAKHSMQSVPLVIHKDIVQVNALGTLDPATHAYSFWEGVPRQARVAFGQLFAKSSTLQCISIVQRAIRKCSPADFMAAYDFGGLELVDTIKSVHMSGSQRSFTAYVFRRAAPSGKAFNGPSSLLLSSYLDAPRFLQTTLPRVLRSRSKASSQATSDQLSQAVSVTSASRRAANKREAAPAARKRPPRVVPSPPSLDDMASAVVHANSPLKENSTVPLTPISRLQSAGDATRAAPSKAMQKQASSEHMSSVQFDVRGSASPAVDRVDSSTRPAEFELSVTEQKATMASQITRESLVCPAQAEEAVADKITLDVLVRPDAPDDEVSLRAPLGCNSGQECREAVATERAPKALTQTVLAGAVTRSRRKPAAVSYKEDKNGNSPSKRGQQKQLTAGLASPSKRACA